MQEKTYDREALNMFRLPYEPPLLGCAKDYIIRAIQKNDKRWVLCFLHRYEAYFNRRIISFMRKNSIRMQSDIFLEMKCACREEVLSRYEGFDITKGASFLAYIDPFIRDAVMNVCRSSETMSSSSLTDYKRARLMGAIYNSCGRIPVEAVKKYCEQTGATEETAWNLLDGARRLENSSYISFDEPAFVHNMLGILWNGISSDDIFRAFGRLQYAEQVLLEARQGVCMGCCRVFLDGKHPTYQSLSEKGENSDAETTSRQYKKAVSHLIYELTDDGVLGCVLIRLKHADAAHAVYSYEPDNSGHIGEIVIDRVNRDFEVTVFPYRDTGSASWQTEEAILEAVLKETEPPQELLIPLIKGDTESELHIRIRQRNLKRKGNRNLSAVYAYRKGIKGSWGIIHFDFTKNVSEVLEFPGRDTDSADWSTEDAICQAVFAMADRELPKNLIIWNAL